MKGLHCPLDRFANGAQIYCKFLKKKTVIVIFICGKCVCLVLLLLSLKFMDKDTSFFFRLEFGIWNLSLNLNVWKFKSDGAKGEEKCMPRVIPKSIDESLFSFRRNCN